MYVPASTLTFLKQYDRHITVVVGMDILTMKEKVGSISFSKNLHLSLRRVSPTTILNLFIYFFTHLFY